MVPLPRPTMAMVHLPRPTMAMVPLLPRLTMAMVHLLPRLTLVMGHLLPHLAMATMPLLREDWPHHRLHLQPLQLTMAAMMPLGPARAVPR